MILQSPVDKRQHQQLAQAAAAQFGTAVELELKSTVFGEFRHYVYQCSGLRSLVENKSSWAKDERFFEFLVSQEPLKMPLGKMHRAFKDCKKSNRGISREFNRWVQQNRRPLLKNLWMLGKICDIHNGAKHDGRMSIKDAARMPVLCRDFLSKLTPRPHPARSPGPGNPRPDSDHDRSRGPSAGHR